MVQPKEPIQYAEKAEIFFQHPLHAQHEERISRVEGQVNELRLSVVKIEKDMSYNNELTQQIKRDTAEVVDITKGMRLIGKILVAVVTIAAAMGAYNVIINTARGHIAIQERPSK